MDNREFLKRAIQPIARRKPYQGDTDFYYNTLTGCIQMLVGFDDKDKKEYLSKHDEYEPVNPDSVIVRKTEKEGISINLK